MNRIIIKALLTEKANLESERKARYTFLVDPRANKLQIRSAIAQEYGVTVEDVNTMIYPPKVKKKFTKTGLQVGKSNKLKKAVVSLAEGQEIDFFSL